MMEVPMKHDFEMYVNRHALLKKFTAMKMPAAESLKLIAPMDNMTEEEKEDFAKALLAELEEKYP